MLVMTSISRGDGGQGVFGFVLFGGGGWGGGVERVKQQLLVKMDSNDTTTTTPPKKPFKYCPTTLAKSLAKVPTGEALSAHPEE